ncbi:MAG: DUF4105 domain-containing protein [Flavobacterium sp.]
MRHFITKIFLVLLFFFNFQNTFSQEIKLSDKAFISILTCDSGNELYSLFGHTAIRVCDDTNNIDVVFNYGTFDFRTPNFYLKFIKGDLQYFVSTNSYGEFISDYRYLQRGVYEQKLNLSPAQIQNIYDTLFLSLYSDSRFYTYKFIDRNCTTMVVDKVQDQLKTPLSLQIKDSNKTNRTILYGYLENHFYENLGINIIFGHKTDKIFDKIFLPLQFMESISKSKNGNLPLSNTTEIVNPKSETPAPFSVWNNIYTYISILAAIVLINRKWLTLGYFIFMGLFGIFLISVGFYSFHSEVEMNYNALLFNPLLLILVYFMIKNNKKWILKTSYINSVLLIIYTLYLINKPNFLMFIPMILTNGILLGKLILNLRKNRI